MRQLTRQKQRVIAKSFEQKSEVSFDNCVGCVDGLLIWIHMPSLEECEKVSVGQTKFVCGMKSKFGLKLLHPTCSPLKHLRFE